MTAFDIPLEIDPSDPMTLRQPHHSVFLPFRFKSDSGLKRPATERTNEE
jgi:hypothetical protein